MAGLFEQALAPAVRRVLEPLFGPRWRWVVALLPVVIFWPALAFWRAVAFDPVHFVEEWTKLALTTLGVFLLVEILQERRHDTVQRNLFESFLLAAVMRPLDTMISSLATLRSTLTSGCVLDASVTLNQTSTELLRMRIAVETASAMFPSLHYRWSLTRVLTEVDFIRLAATARDLAATRTWYAIPTEELEELLRGLSAAVALVTAQPSEARDEGKA